MQDTINFSVNRIKNSENEGKNLIGISGTTNSPQESVSSDSNFEFENHLKRQKLSPRTIKEYLNYHRKMNIILEQFELNQDVIDAYLDQYNNSPSRAYLKQFLSFKKDKTIEIPKLRGRTPRKKPEILSDEDRGKVLEYLYDWNLRYGLCIELISECGLRHEELIKIKLANFDWQNWTLDKSSPCRLRVEGKGSKERDVIIPSILMQGLFLYLKKVKQEENKNFFQVGYRRLGAIFQRACLECLGKSYTLHSLRHGKALDWYKKGKDLISIKNRLGHSSVSTTEIYISPDSEEELVSWEKELS